MWLSQEQTEVQTAQSLEEPGNYTKHSPGLPGRRGPCITFPAPKCCHLLGKVDKKTGASCWKRGEAGRAPTDWDGREGASARGLSGDSVR